jgi:hypothetical protein
VVPLVATLALSTLIISARMAVRRIRKSSAGSHSRESRPKTRKSRGARRVCASHVLRQWELASDGLVLWPPPYYLSRSRADLNDLGAVVYSSSVTCSPRFRSGSVIRTIVCRYLAIDVILRTTPAHDLRTAEQASAVG